MAVFGGRGGRKCSGGRGLEGLVSVRQRGVASLCRQSAGPDKLVFTAGVHHVAIFDGVPQKKRADVVGTLTRRRRRRRGRRTFSCVARGDRGMTGEPSRRDVDPGLSIGTGGNDVCFGCAASTRG